MQTSAPGSYIYSPNEIICVHRSSLSPSSGCFRLLLATSLLAGDRRVATVLLHCLSSMAVTMLLWCLCARRHHGTSMWIRDLSSFSGTVYFCESDGPWGGQHLTPCAPTSRNLHCTTSHWLPRRLALHSMRPRVRLLRASAIDSSRRK
jgi:hypothetical protein